MPFRRRRFRSRRSSPLRAREWIGFNLIDPGTGLPTLSLTLTSTAGGTLWANYIVSPDDMFVLFDEPTLVRGILDVSIIHDTNTPVAKHYMAMGIIKSTIEAPAGALAAGALPFVADPFLDADSPWIWQRVINFQTVAGFTGFEIHTERPPELEFKTKRKFQNGEGLMLVILYHCSIVGQNILVNVGGRLLFLNR